MCGNSCCAGTAPASRAAWSYWLCWGLLQHKWALLMDCCWVYVSGVQGTFTSRGEDLNLYEKHGRIAWIHSTTINGKGSNRVILQNSTYSNWQEFKSEARDNMSPEVLVTWTGGVVARDDKAAKSPKNPSTLVEKGGRSVVNGELVLHSMVGNSILTQGNHHPSMNPWKFQCNAPPLPWRKSRSFHVDVMFAWGTSDSRQQDWIWHHGGPTFWQGKVKTWESRGFETKSSESWSDVFCLEPASWFFCILSLIEFCVLLKESNMSLSTFIGKVWFENYHCFAPALSNCLWGMNFYSSWIFQWPRVTVQHYPPGK